MTQGKDSKPSSSGGWQATPQSRRSFLKGMGLAAGAAGAAVALPGGGSSAETKSDKPEIPGVRVLGRKKQRVTMTVNGSEVSANVEPRVTLLDCLREMGMTGTKEVCDRGACGCCTVILDGKTVNSCMTLAVDCAGCDIVTIEGVAKDPKYARLIEAYCEHDGAQCGFCIPGFVVQSAAFMENHPGAGRDELHKAIAGNICRCGTYSKIFDALDTASKGGV